MMHSQMPVQSLLCALLMLPLAMPQGLVDLRLSDEAMQTAAGFAVMEYNAFRTDSPTYYKKVRVMHAQSPVAHPNIYHLTLALVQTACLRRSGTTLSYRKIQQCNPYPSNAQISCYFKVTLHHGDTMTLDTKVCHDSLDQWNP